MTLFSSTIIPYGSSFSSTHMPCLKLSRRLAGGNGSPIFFPDDPPPLTLYLFKHRLQSRIHGILLCSFSFQRLVHPVYHQQLCRPARCIQYQSSHLLHEAIWQYGNAFGSRKAAGPLGKALRRRARAARGCGFRGAQKTIRECRNSKSICTFSLFSGGDLAISDKRIDNKWCICITW